jgi:hypothetical protein
VASSGLVGGDSVVVSSLEHMFDIVANGPDGKQAGAAGSRPEAGSRRTDSAKPPVAARRPDRTTPRHPTKPPKRRATGDGQRRLIRPEDGRIDTGTTARCAARAPRRRGEKRDVTVGEQIGGAGDRLPYTYTYDSGDDWQHEIVVGALLDPIPRSLPRPGGRERSLPTRGLWRPWGTPNSRTSSPIPGMNDTKKCLTASDSATPPNSIPPPSLPTTSRRSSPSAAPAADTRPA